MNTQWFSPRYLGRLLIARLLQFLGNVLKLVFWIHHTLFPNARFVIPAKTPALVQCKNSQRIPRIFWITNYDNRVTLSLYANHLWNRWLSPTFEHRFCDDAACLSFVRENCDARTVAAYSSLQIGAAKADYWRALVLAKIGGVYADIDAALCWPLEWMLDADQNELFVQQKDGTITNYFVACASNHSIMTKTTAQICRNIEENTIQNVFHLTGPAVLNEIAQNQPIKTDETRIVCRQAMMTNKSLQYPGALHRYWGTAQKERAIVGNKESADGVGSVNQNPPGHQ